MTQTIRDLQSLLQSTLGSDLVVESYVMKDLLPPGENYGSHIVSLHVVAKRNNRSEDLHLVAKLPPATQVQREMFDSPTTFRKEIFMYSKILPFYRRLEIENGVSEDEAFNISPTCYGSRLSLDPDGDFDDDAVILLENLKLKDYYCTERRTGCDLAHARWAIRAMARFHALGMATKEKDPEFLEVLKARSKCIDFKNPEDWVTIIQQRVKDIADDPVTKEHYAACVAAMDIGDISSWLAVPPEPWSSVIHADFWANNMMYRKNSSGEPDDIKLIDYQNYLFLSPTRELTFFVACGLDHDTVGHIDELIDLYYDTVIERLKLLNCNVEPYSRETFDERIKQDGSIEFTHCISMLKIITLDVDASNPDSHNVKNLMEHSDSNEAYRVRLRDLVQTYVKRGWLKK